MDQITKSPGLCHIAEKIFMNLNQEVLLLKCQQVNEHWKSIVRNPLFWYEKCDQIVIFETNDEKVLLRKIIQVLFRDHVKKEVATITLIKIFSKSKRIQSLHTFLNEFYPIDWGKTIISWAANNGFAEIVKILVPFTDNPNDPDHNGRTPIY